MSSLLATVNVVDDPGYRIVHATYRGLMYVSAGANTFDVQMLLDGTLVQAHRWSPGSPTELNVTLSRVLYVGPGVHVITAEISFFTATGTTTSVATFGDPNYNILEYVTLPAGGI